MDYRLITIGIRATPKKVVYSVYDAAQNEVVTVDDIIVPLAFDAPDALKYVRSNLLDILREYKVVHAGVRVTEPTSQSLNVTRVQFEGVILEAFASSPLRAYYIGQISSIASRIGVPRDQLKLMIKNRNSPDIENWEAHSEEQREAILCAIGAKNA